MTVREVHLYGAHAEVFLLAVESPAEAVRAMMTLRPDLREHLRQNNWRVVIGPLEDGYDVDAHELGAKAGRQPIHFIPEVELAGGFFRSSIGKIIIGAVLIAAAIFLGPAGAIIGGVGAGVLGGTVATAVLGMGISMVLGGTAMLLSPTPKAPKATEQANAEERPSFFFNGPVNISEQGAPIPLIYGYFRAGSIVVNVGLWNENLSAEEIEGGDTSRAAPMVAPALIADGTQAGSRLYPNRDDLKEVERLRLAKGGGKGASTGAAYTPREAPNSLGSRSYIRIHEVLCEGGIQGPRTWPNWGRAVYFDDTPLQRSDNGFNFKLSFAWYRGGWPNEGPIPGFPASEVTVSVGTEVRYGAPIIRRVSSLQTTLIRLQIRVPQLMYQHPNGDILATGVDVQVDYQVEGQPWTFVFWDRIEGKTTTGYERSYSFWLPPRDTRQIDLRVTRLSIDSGDVTPGKAFNETFWSSFVEMVDGQMLHNTEASMAFAVDAEQFPSIPKRSYEFDWLIVQVPTNYDPRNHVYTGDWDGTFKWEWTNNPAWVLYDLLTHSVRGLGRDLSAGVVDKWSFYQAAQYNDDLISDGLGGVEPRFTFNGMLNTQEEAINILQAVASSFRAQFYVAGGVLYLAQDRPVYNALARVFTPGSVVNGSFDYQSTEQKSRITAVNVSWIDPTQNWQPQVEPVLYPDMIGRFGYREISIAGYGVTSRGQAIRQGRYFLWGAHHEQEIVSFNVGLENADLRPGDVVGIQDPSRAAVEWSGRVVAVAGNVVTLDRPVTGVGGGTIYFSTLDPATFLTKTFDAGITHWVDDRTLEVIVFAGNPAGATLDDIKPDSVWALVSSTVNITLWAVLSVAEQENLQFQITAAFHDERKYTYVEQNIVLPGIDYSALPSGPLAPPQNLAAEDFYSLDPQGAPQAGIIFSWTPPPDSRVIQYIGDLHGPSRAPQHYTSIPGTTLALASAETGEWTLIVKSADAVGRRSVPAQIIFNTATSARVPLPPINFTVQQTGGHSAFLQWDPPDDFSISFWWLKWTAETNPLFVSWDAAITVQSTIPRNTQSMVLTAQTGTFLLKSVSVRGKESATYAADPLSMTDLRPFGAYRAEQPTWIGTKSAFIVETGELVLPAATAFTAGYGSPVHAMRLPRDIRPAEALTVGEYITAPLALTQSAEILSKVLLAGRGVVAADIMANWIPLAIAVPLTRTTSADWDTQIDERSSPDNVTWTAWRKAQSARFFARYVQYRLQAAAYTVGTAVKFTRMEEWLMLPEYEQSGSGTTSAAGFVTINLNPDYYVPAEVHIQPAGATTAILSLTEVYADRFTVRSTTPAGAAAGTIAFTYTVYGYGRLP